VGLDLPVSPLNSSVLLDEMNKLPGVLRGGAAMTGASLALSGAGNYVSLPSNSLGTSAGLTLVVAYTPADVSSKQVVASFGNPATTGMEFGIDVGGYAYVMNRGNTFLEATPVVAGAQHVSSVVCAANRVYCFIL
jgi:hypothetical protein